MNHSTGPADPGNEDVALAGALFMVKMGARVLPVAARTKRALLKDWAKQASDDPDMVTGLGTASSWLQLGHGLRQDRGA